MITDDEVNSLKTIWKELADQSYDIFGSEVEFFYRRIKSDESLIENNIFNSVNIKGKEPSRFYLEEDTSETIKVKLYWKRKEWNRIVGDITIPDNGLLMLSKITDYEKIKDAIYAEFKNSTDVYKLTMSAKQIPHSFNSDKYVLTIWEY